ncbi:uridine-cytidine kinase-like 1 isoform X3 [Alligator sinensis]|uniref:Uridine-cytidine kinase n=1 Tax=Alligator sinensis TaxID=38654 RepID=A0A1U7RPD9_ALLSI|nr:uridine-cytidine kinase-like 1 isoform X3 [Alligator sinensis]
MSSPPTYAGVRISGCWALGAEGSHSSAESLDRLYPPVAPTRPPRKRTTSQCKSEPPLLRTSKRTIYTAGRPPWYNEHGAQSKEAFVIGLGGGSASGKTTVARMIIEALDVPWVVLLSMDSFYKVLTKQQQEQAAHNDFNFDHPDAFDFDLIIATLKKLKQGKSVKIPIYDFTTHSRKKEWKTLYGANVIIFEGIMAFADKELLKLLDLKIFVDTDSDIRLVRRLRRDISERGRDIEGVIKQYNKFVKPAFDQYIQPTLRLADIVVPRGSGNTVAIDLIVQHVHSQLEEGSAGFGPPVPPAPADPQCAEEHPASEGHAHHHQEQGDQPRRVHLLLQATDEAADRARPVLPAFPELHRPDPAGTGLRRTDLQREADHGRVDPESGGDDGAGPARRVQRCPHRDHPHPDQLLHWGARAPLPAAAEGHQRRPRDPHGLHSLHRGSCHDGSEGPAGS